MLFFSLLNLSSHSNHSDFFFFSILYSFLSTFLFSSITFDQILPYSIFQELLFYPPILLYATPHLKNSILLYPDSSFLSFLFPIISYPLQSRFTKLFFNFWVNFTGAALIRFAALYVQSLAFISLSLESIVSEGDHTKGMVGLDSIPPTSRVRMGVVGGWGGGGSDGRPTITEDRLLVLFGLSLFSLFALYLSLPLPISLFSSPSIHLCSYLSFSPSFSHATPVVRTTRLE